jgi:hypothetical protein
MTLIPIFPNISSAQRLPSHGKARSGHTAQVHIAPLTPLVLLLQWLLCTRTGAIRPS